MGAVMGNHQFKRVQAKEIKSDNSRSWVGAWISIVAVIVSVIVVAIAWPVVH